MYQHQIANLDHALSRLSCYTDKNRIRKDVEQVLKQIPSLLPSTGLFTHNTGATSSLLNLSGTIPIFYNGNQYNIPIELWIIETYPYSPPLTYVRPTQEMMIKSGHPHVDSNGLVSLPYILQWNPSTHTLVDLIGHQSSVFGMIPPVFKKPSGISTPQYYQPTSRSGSASPSTGYQYEASNTQYEAANSIQGGPNASFGVSNRDVLNYPRPDPRRKFVSDATTKIQKELHKVYKRIKDELDTQFENQIHLSDGSDKLKLGVDSLDKLNEDIVEATSKIRGKEKELSQWIEEQEANPVIDPDSSLVPADAWTKQLLDAFSEQQAIEDALYHMDRALSNGEIKLDVFLKEVRKLTRQQFLAVALMQKIYDMQNDLYTNQTTMSNSALYRGMSANMPR